MMLKWIQVLMVILMVGGLISALPLQEAEGRSSRMRRNTNCIKCPAGKYCKSCNECADCPRWTYNSKENTERRCHSCYKNCRPEFHMQVVKNCSSVSDVVCRCMDGYVCKKKDPYTNQCTLCSPIPTSQPTTTSTTQHDPEPKTTPDDRDKVHAGIEVWIVVVVLLSLTLSVFITMHLCRRRKKCLKDLVKRCSHANQKTNAATTASPIAELISQAQAEKADSPTPTSDIPDIPSPQPASTEQLVPPHGNLGPLHIYGAGTVFVSLLNQFGQNGREKEEEHLQQGGLNESELRCPSSPSTPSSPPLPLSTEENSKDSGFVFFPSQEQGKECHMSKEEGLY
ncbi:tumor necrosis factor receptor superfamily member 1A isoform X1 [Astyanax mexicanus]|uniref:tumor necrosis factor receptor superfamily member 1A isoform X1 n=1 Tax=Astyanax mexicanus TaxID=7994 RepID=UPI000BBD6FED|nr:tumor necrosis factor receptor superfamily member 1A isoform X1 [Astyanax mexicanus]XP_007249853.2 tumor necrosis factor receptor superfamily member 1A isoform X1 [Astyanax mexicanus]